MLDLCAELIALVSQQMQKESHKNARNFAVRADLHLDVLKHTCTANRRRLHARLRTEVAAMIGADDQFPNETVLREFAAKISPSEILTLLRLELPYQLPPSVVTEDVKDCLVKLIVSSF